MDFSKLTAFLNSLPGEGIPGTDCTVFWHHRPVYRHTNGFMDEAKTRPMTRDARFFMYSCSKVITCTAALQLFEQGKFLLNDPLSFYMPEFADMTVYASDKNGNKVIVPCTRPIQIKDLFTMSAGFTYDLASEDIIQLQKETDGRCPTRDVMKVLAKRPLSFTPGTHWQYSLCHDVLAALVEVISGQRFADYIKDHIFLPLGMTHSCFHPEDCLPGSIAPLFRFDDNTKTAHEIPLANSYIIGTEYDSGGAGIISTVDDYILFVDAMSNFGLGRTGNRILTKPTVELMRTNQLDPTRMLDFNWEQMAGYGYGLGVRTMTDCTQGNLSAKGEFGWGGAAGAYVMIDPDNEIAVFYAQHMLNNLEPYVHPRLRNVIYVCLNS